MKAMVNKMHQSMGKFTIEKEKSSTKPRIKTAVQKEVVQQKLTADLNQDLDTKFQR